MRSRPPPPPPLRCRPPPHRGCAQVGLEICLTICSPPSDLIGSVLSFRPPRTDWIMCAARRSWKLRRSGLALSKHPEDYDRETFTRNEMEYIEMDLILGVADLRSEQAVDALKLRLTAVHGIMKMGNRVVIHPSHQDAQLQNQNNLLQAQQYNITGTACRRAEIQLVVITVEKVQRWWS